MGMGSVWCGNDLSTSKQDRAQMSTPNFMRKIEVERDRQNTPDAKPYQTWVWAQFGVGMNDPAFRMVHTCQAKFSHLSSCRTGIVVDEGAKYYSIDLLSVNARYVTN